MQWTPSDTRRNIKRGAKIPVFCSSSIPRDPEKEKWRIGEGDDSIPLELNCIDRFIWGKIDIYKIINFIQQLECLSTLLVFFKCPSVHLWFYSYLAYLFFWLCWVFVATHGLSLVVACRAQTLEHAGSVIAVFRLGCAAARGILVPWSRLKPASPALEGRFLITALPEKPQYLAYLWSYFCLSILVFLCVWQ